MAILKQSTTYTRTFLMVATSDHITGITGATVAVNISKAGATGAAAGGTVSQVDATNMPGLYKIALTTTDTNTLGDLSFHCTATSADPTDFVDQVCANILGDTLPANATQINSVSTSSVTTISANQGTTQPLNFTGTGGSALVKSDMTDIAGAAVSTTTAQIGVNVVNINAQTATAAAGVTFPSSIASPTNITAGTITTATNLTNAPTSGDFTATMKTSLNASTPASITGAVGSVTGNVGGNVVGSVGSVTGNVGGSVSSVTGAVGSVTGNVGGSVASVTGAVGSVTGNVGGSVASVTGAVTVGAINATASNLKKNNGLNNFELVMTDSTTHAPKTGLTVTAQRSIDGGAFANCTNSVTEVANGVYAINLASTDLNGAVITFRFTATGADDKLVTIVTQP